MKSIFSKTKVELIYNKIKKLSIKSFKDGHFSKALNFIRFGARVAYVFNHIYKDDEFDNLLKRLSLKVIKNQNDFSPIKNRFVFFDGFGLSNQGLVHQYIRALIAWNVEFLYICGSKKVESEIILNEISLYPKSIILIIDLNLNKCEQINQVYNGIANYKPQKAFLYLTPWDVVALTAFYALPQVVKYQINLTDHAFWLGVSCIDYSIEFRNYGFNISNKKREIPIDKLLIQPFYPVVIQSEFKGLPSDITSDKVILFSGGAYYKIYGNNGFYFRIVKQLLDSHKNTVLIYAGTGEDKPFKQFIKENKFEDRVYLVGFRSDINEIFENCDIYLGTYPTSGGLMSQYAGINKKPILAFAPNNDKSGIVEDFVFQNNKDTTKVITHLDMDDFFEEARKLIENIEYRISVGELYSNNIISPEQFNFDLYNLIETNTNQIQITDIELNNESLFERNIEIENNYVKTFGLYLFSHLKLSAIFYFPIYAINYLPTLLLRYRNLIFKKNVKKQS